MRSKGIALFLAVCCMVSTCLGVVDAKAVEMPTPEITPGGSGGSSNAPANPVSPGGSGSSEEQTEGEITVARITYTYHVMDDQTVEITAIKSYNMQNEILFPDEINGKTVTSIGDNVFSNRRYWSVAYIPDSVVHIGENEGWAYGRGVIRCSENSYAQQYAIGRDKPYIIKRPLEEFTEGDYRYQVLENDTVTITRYLGEGSDIEIPSMLGGRKVTEIDGGAFYGCEGESFLVPEGVEYVGDYAFGRTINWDECHVTMPKSLKDMGRQESSIVTMGDGYEYVIRGRTGTSGHETYAGAVGYIGEQTDIAIPDNIYGIPVTGIGDEGIDLSEKYHFNTLKSIVLPDSVRVIGENTFLNCGNLTAITMQGVKHIKEGAFHNCTGLAEIILPVIEEINSEAFQGCSNLETVVLSEEIKEIRLGSFMECSKLKSITIPESIRYIRAYAFEGCSSLTTITLPKVKTVSREAFADCTSLESVVAPRLEIIDEEAFLDCRSLSGMALSRGTSSIGIDAFRGCDNFTLYCEENSYAHIYAEWESIPYQLITSITDRIRVASLQAEKTKTVYYTGDVLTVNDVKAIVTYSDQTKKAVTDYTTNAGQIDMSGAGVKTLKIVYHESGIAVETSLNIRVDKKPENFDKRDPSDEGTANGNENEKKVSAPKRMKTPTLKNKRKGTLTITYKKVSGGSDGYEVLYATNKKFKDSKKLNTASLTVSVKKAAKGKTYYVKVRAYNLNAAGEKVYGAYSKVRKMKIKK